MKKIIIITCAILLAVGCKQEEERRLSVLQKENMEIKGILPSTEDIATRTILDTDGLLTLWEEGDAIGVYGNGSSNVSLTLTSGARTPFGIFKGAQTGVPVAAYYPYSESAGDSYNDIRGFLDSIQVQNENANQIASYDWKVSSHITGNDRDGFRIHFREIMVMLDFTLDVSGTILAGESIQSVSFCNPDKKMAGHFSIDMSSPAALPQFDQHAACRITAGWEDPPVEEGRTLNVRMFANTAITSGDPLRIIVKQPTTSLPQTYNRQKRLKPDTVTTFRCHFPNCRIRLPLKKKPIPGITTHSVFTVWKIHLSHTGSSQTSGAS